MQQGTLKGALLLSGHKKMRKKYKIIVFDLGNTLIRFDHAISAKKIAGICRCTMKKIYDTFFDSPLTRDFERGIITPKEFYRGVEGLLGARISFDDFAEVWKDIFWEDEPACRLARELKKSYRLFLLSNINRLHYEHIRSKFDIIKIFDEIILSYVIGAMKPDRRIFEEVIKRAGGDRKGLVYIDDRDDLIKAAKRLGIDSIKFDGARKLRATLKAKNII